MRAGARVAARVAAPGYTRADPLHYHGAMSTQAPIPAPFACTGPRVADEWIDYNGHMNVGYYLVAFDRGSDRFFDFIGVGVAYKERTNRSTFTLESHLNFVRELGHGDPMRFTFQLVDHDRKRLHGFGRMFHAEQGYVAATMEWLTLHVDLGQRRGAEMGEELYRRFAAIKAAHDGLGAPAELGRVIGLDRKRAA